MSETQTELQAFENKYLQAFKDLGHLEALKKQTEDKLKKVREQIEQGMDKYDIAKIDNEYVTITRIPENQGKETVDLDAFAKEEPEEYAELVKDYPKVTGKKKAYIRITVKGGK